MYCKDCNRFVPGDYNFIDRCRKYRINPTTGLEEHREARPWSVKNWGWPWKCEPEAKPPMIPPGGKNPFKSSCDCPPKGCGESCDCNEQ